MAALGERESAGTDTAHGGSRRWSRATARPCCASRTSSRSATTTRWTPTSARSRSTCASSTRVDPATEGAWLRVVVKHEAMAIRRARLDSVDRDDVDLDTSVHGGLREVDDEVAGGERVDRSVEALRALKPDEARALLLKAEGLSYQEIGRHFGWTYTKVNRSITEGRARFLKAFTRHRGGRGVRAPRGGAERARRRHRDERARWSRSARTCATARPAGRRCATCASRARGGSRCCCRSAGWRGCSSRSDVDACTRPPTAAGGSGRRRRCSGSA